VNKDLKKYLDKYKKISGNIFGEELKEVKELFWYDPKFTELCKNEKEWDTKYHDIFLDLMDLHKRDGYYRDKYDRHVSYNGIKTLKKTGTELELSDIHENEILKCQDFKYFRKFYCKIQTKNGISRPEPRNYQEKLEDALLSMEDVAASFSRQCINKEETIIVNDEEMSIEELFNESKLSYKKSEKK